MATDSNGSFWLQVAKTGRNKFYAPDDYVQDISITNWESGGYPPTPQAVADFSAERLAQQLVDLVPVINYLRFPCPASYYCYGNGLSFVLTPATLSRLIIHLTDNHQWSRERIAERLKEVAEELGTSFQIQEDVHKADFGSYSIHCEYCKEPCDIRTIGHH